MTVYGKRARTVASGAIAVLVACAAFYAGRHVGMDAAETESSSPEKLADTVSMKALDSIQQPANPPQAGAVNYLWTPVGNVGTPVEALRKTNSLPESDAPENEPPRYSAWPTGRLGKPVGTLMTIQGEDAKRRYKLGNCLLVTQINGEELDNPIPISIEGKKVSEVYGKQITGFETGKMIGIPQGIKGWHQVQAGWQFYCEFVIVDPDKLEPDAL